LLAEDDPSVPGLELELAVALAGIGSFGEAIDLFADAEQRAVDPCLSGHIRIARLNARLNFEPEGMDAAIRRECERVIPLFEAHGDHRALSRAWYALGQVEWAETQMEATDRAMTTAAAHAHRAGDRGLELLTLVSRAGWLGTTSWSTSETRRELERLTRRFPGEPAVERVLRFWRVFSAYQEGRAGDARALARDWLDDVRRHDSPMMAESFAMFFALNELLTGDVDRAERLALDAVEALQDCGVRAYLGSAKSVLAEVRAAQGRAREAVELADESVRIGSSADRVNLVAAHAVQARAYAMLGEHEQAKAAATEAVAVAGQTDSLLIQATAQKALAHALLAAGELPAARAAAVEAERLFGTLERFLTQQPATALVAQIERELAAASAPPVLAGHREGGD
ncbi:MAG TPA: hypothetical protein VLD16_07555, partial [Gaiellaceae bacterium]|nr:hypothetical protein [Gaiellaceae bacterium]